MFRIDNDTKYFNNILGNFFEENGILHQSYCVNTPKQKNFFDRKRQRNILIKRKYKRRMRNPPTIEKQDYK